MNKIKKQTLDIHELIDETLKIITHQISDKNVVIIKCYQFGLPQICYDNKKLIKILLSYFIDALDKIKNCGILRIETELPLNKMRRTVIISVSSIDFNIDLKKETESTFSPLTNKFLFLNMIDCINTGKIWSKGNFIFNNYDTSHNINKMYLPLSHQY